MSENDSAMFDTEAFANQSVEGEMSTHVIPIPEDEYNAVIEKIGVRNGVSDKGPWATLDVFWDIDAPQLHEELGRDKLVSRQSIFLDILNGQLDTRTGKNTQLGRLREAVGQNRPGNWNPQMLVGQVARVSVSQRMYEGEMYDEVKRVTAL